MCDWCGHVPKDTLWVDAELLLEARACSKHEVWMERIQEMKELMKWVQHRILVLERNLTQEHGEACKHY